MALSPLETRLGEATRDKSVVIVGFDNGFKTTLALRTITERLNQGERVLYISSKTDVTPINNLLNENHLKAKSRGKLVISPKIKVEKLWASAELIGATTVVLDSIYDYKLNFPKKIVERLVAEAKERNIGLILTQPIKEEYKIGLPAMIEDNTAIYLVRDRLLKTMDVTWLTYETADGVHLRTLSKSKKPATGAIRANISKEALFL